MSNAPRIALLAVLTLFVTACVGTAVSTPRQASTQVPAVTGAPRTTDAPGDEPTDEPAAEETLEPDSDTEHETYQAKVGEVVRVTQNDEPYLDIVVSKPGYKKSYGSGYLKDTPGKGNVYLQVFVTYKSLAGSASYNQFDWSLFVDGTAVDNWAFVTEGPKPSLSSGDLPKGRTAKGWIIYEIPAKSKEIVLSYGLNSFTNEPPVFEVGVKKP